MGIVLAGRLDQPLWLDEAWHVQDVFGTRTTYLDVQLRERGFEWLLATWGGLMGKQVSSLRALMLLQGLAATWLVMLAARRAQADPVAAGLAFCAFSAVCRYVVELNRYAETLLGAAIAIWALLRLRERPHPIDYATLGLAGVGAFYIHHTAALTIVTVSCCALIAQATTAPAAERRARLAGMVAVPVGQLLLMLPEIRLVLRRLSTYSAEQESVYAHVYRGPSPSAAWEILGDLGPGAGTPLALHVLATVVTVGLVATGLRGGGPTRLLAGLSLGPLLAAAVGSLAQPMFLTRIVLPATPALALLAGRAGGPTRRGPLRGAILLLTCATWVGFWRTPWPENPAPVFEAIDARWQHGDGLVVHPPFAGICLDGNQLAGVARLPPMEPRHVEAPTRLRAASPDYAGFPARTFFVLYAFKGSSAGLRDELPLHFERIEHVVSSPGFELVLASGPLSRAEALARSRQASEPSAALTAYREGVLLLHANRPTEALTAFQRAQQALPTGLATDARQAEDDRGQIAWGLAWSAHLSGERELARAALLEAEAHGSTIAPAARRAILGE
jgi:hypothetical protein